MQNCTPGYVSMPWYQFAQAKKSTFRMTPNQSTTHKVRTEVQQTYQTEQWNNAFSLVLSLSLISVKINKRIHLHNSSMTAKQLLAELFWHFVFESWNGSFTIWICVLGVSNQNQPLSTENFNKTSWQCSELNKSTLTSCCLVLSHYSLKTRM